MLLHFLDHHLGQIATHKSGVRLQECFCDDFRVEPGSAANFKNRLGFVHVGEGAEGG